MQTLFLRFLVLCLCLTTLSANAANCTHSCYKDNADLPCRPECYTTYPESRFQVDNACVDFCLDHEHSFAECQKSCWN